MYAVNDTGTIYNALRKFGTLEFVRCMGENVVNGVRSNEVRLYTYFLGQSPNFVLFRILKFGFSDFFYEFSSNFHWNRYCSYNFQWIPLKLCTVIISVSLHIFFFSVFWNLFLFFFLRIFIKFSLKSLLLLQFPMDSFETRYTYSLGQSSHLLFRFLKCVFFLGGGARIFIQFSFKLLLLLQYLMDSIEIRYRN